jgi:Ca2+-binding EF-hand superfamily protein
MQNQILSFVLGLATGVGLTIAVSYVLLAPEPRLRFDINKDGEISYGEFKSSISAMFSIIDTNGDDRITPKEHKKVVDDAGQDLGKAFASGIWFKRFDRNRDGILSLKEARQTDVLTKWFKNADKNGNGKISINEIEDKAAVVIFTTR